MVTHGVIIQAVGVFILEIKKTIMAEMVSRSCCYFQEQQEMSHHNDSRVGRSNDCPASSLDQHIMFVLDKLETKDGFSSTHHHVSMESRMCVRKPKQVWELEK